MAQGKTGAEAHPAGGDLRAARAPVRGSGKGRILRSGKAVRRRRKAVHCREKAVHRRGKARLTPAAKWNILDLQKSICDYNFLYS